MKKRTARVGWIVDVQNDFAKRSLPGGRLYVRDLFDDSDPGAEAVQRKVERAVDILRRHADAVVYTGDWHSREDREIDPVSPDPQQGTYPPHCMGISSDEAEREGAAIIAEIRPADPLVLEREASDEEARAVARRAVREERPVFIRKSEFNVFTGNRATEAFLDALQEALGTESLEFYVLGHAREVCVTQFIDEVQRPPRRDRGYRVIAITDAMAGLGLEPEAETLARWERGGAETISTAELERRLLASTRASEMPR
jgi:nicotinamidase-related amidase